MRGKRVGNTFLVITFPRGEGGQLPSLPPPPSSVHFSEELLMGQWDRLASMASAFTNGKGYTRHVSQTLADLDPSIFSLLYMHVCNSQRTFDDGTVSFTEVPLEL